MWTFDEGVRSASKTEFEEIRSETFQEITKKSGPMTLEDKMARQGEWLFRHRSYLPLILLPLIIVALMHKPSVERWGGSSAENAYEAFCILISFAGLFIRCYTVGHVPAGTSGRNTKGQEASRLNTSGIYSIVRHPLYLGNFIIYLGVILFAQSIWLLLVGMSFFALYYERIMLAEERFLKEKFGEDFLRWAETTPAFFPDFKKWKANDLPFSMRNVLRREYSGFFGIVASFTAFKLIRTAFLGEGFNIGTGWIVLFASGLVVYLVLRTLKRKTRLLHVEGR